MKITHEQKVDFWEQLVVSADAASVLEKKTDIELADLLIDHVWADKSLVSAASALIEEVISRLRNANKETTE